MEKGKDRMGDLLYLVAFVSIILWLVSCIGFAASVENYIHLLVVMAIIALEVRLVRGRSEV